MKFSENWLRQHVRTDASRDELAATLTAIGLEVEDVTPLGTGLDGVVVALLLAPDLHGRERIGGPPAPSGAYWRRWTSCTTTLV